MKPPLAVAFERRAISEVEQIDRWWRENRRDTEDLFFNELEKMLGAIALLPTLGATARSARLSGVRRVLLQRTSYHVYYRVNDDTLEILAVWHAARGVGPNL